MVDDWIKITMHDIERLKRYVIQSKDLNEPLNYFFDLTDANMFSQIKSHRPIENINQHIELMAVVQLIQKEMNQRLGKIIQQVIPIFHEIPDHYFYHGACLSVDFVMPLTVIYFTDVKTGIVATYSAQTEMFRFSLMTYSDGKEKH